MLSKDDIVLHVNYIHSVIWVIISKVLQYFELNSCLVVVLLFIFNDFKSNHFLSFVIEASYGLSERTLSQKLLDFISVANMIVHANLVVPFVIVVSIVELVLHRSLGLSLAILTHIKDLGVVDDLLELILGEVLFRILQSDLRSGGLFYV